MAGKDIAARLRSIDFKALGSYRTELLGAAVLIAFAFLFHTYIYKNELAKAKSLDVEILAKESEIVMVEARSKAIAGLKRSVKESSEKIQRVESRLESLKERLPSTRHISNLLTELSGEGGKGDVRIISIRPMAAEDKGELVRLPFQVNVESAFFSFGEYIKRLENLERVVVIENFKIEATGNGAEDGKAATQQLAAQVYLSAYILGPAN